MINDALYLGDVLGSLLQPAATLRELLDFPKPGRLLFVKRVLHNNARPVFWAARLFGILPTHLLRVSEAQQLAFFTRVEPGLSLLHWDVQQTGWLYASDGALKRAVAGAASPLCGKRIGRETFSSRFRGVFRFPPMVRQ